MGRPPPSPLSRPACGRKALWFGHRFRIGGRVAPSGVQMINTRRIALAVVAPVAAIGLMVPAVPASAATANRYVATTGTDTGACLRPAHPCKTISYAETHAAAGDTVSVAAGTYNESVMITKPVTISGAGPGKTIVNGSGIDYSAHGRLGLIDVADEPSATSGTITVANLTVNNAFITAAEASLDQSPVDILNGDNNAGQHVVATDVLFGGGPNEQAAGGIGYYSLSAGSPGEVDHSTFQNLFQGVLVEGAGAPLTVTSDKFQHLIALSSGATNYPPEGVHQLSDESGTNTLNVNNSTFTAYNGYGVKSNAGYDNSNCSPVTGNTCTGTADLQMNANIFSLGGSAGAAGIYLYVLSSGDAMNATLTGNTGSVAKPSSSIEAVNGGGTLNLTESGNSIANP